VYGSEKQPVREMSMKRMNTWEKKILRRIYEPMVGREYGE